MPKGFPNTSPAIIPQLKVLDKADKPFSGNTIAVFAKAKFVAAD